MGTQGFGGLDVHNNRNFAIYPAFDTLIEYDAQHQPQPLLAESWEFNSDSTQLKINLRHGVEFHTGRELSSDDVKFNILRVRDPSVAAFTNFMSRWLTDIQTPDKYTLNLVMDQPHAGIFDMLELIAMQDQVTLQSPDASSMAVGTGPFKFVEWVAGDHFTLAKNPNYWQNGLPYLDQLVSMIATDFQARDVQMESGAIDMVAPTIQDAVRYQQDPQYQILRNPDPLPYALAINTGMPPLDNNVARQAFGYAMDRDRIVQTVLHGLATAIDIPWPPSSPAYDVQLEHVQTFDLEKASSLFQQAGISNASFDFAWDGGTAWLADMAQIYQSNLATIGIHLNLKPMETNAFNSYVGTQDPSLTRKYPGLVANGNIANTQFDPSTVGATSAWGRTKANNEGFNNDQYVQWMDQAATEPDLAKRKQLYNQINQLYLDQAFLISYVAVPALVAARANVHNVAWRLATPIRYEQVWLD
ncbi:MAG: ABC transporter substrate-binding protein [Chloroflexi bacterium]|nr:ABC transporter substrate-binding protein [Chloroflexota bacterium]MBV9601778.1 ABC transporter substrate-binding protein [Chloroflexota bacterium]